VRTFFGHISSLGLIILFFLPATGLVRAQTASSSLQTGEPILESRGFDGWVERHPGGTYYEDRAAESAAGAGEPMGFGHSFVTLARQMGHQVRVPSMVPFVEVI